MILKAGDKAPDFSLYSTVKEKVTLSDLKGHNVVLLFFPFAFTSTCTAELCSIRDGKEVYDQLEAKVFGISVDSVATLSYFKASHNFNFELLSDFNKEVCRSYGAFYDEFTLGMRGVAKRAAFVIDKNGFLKYTEVLENAGSLPDFEDIKNTLAKLN